MKKISNKFHQGALTIIFFGDFLVGMALNLEKVGPTYFEQNWDPFLESPGNFSGPESCFMFAVFVFKIKVLFILKMIK